jgi:hypothetical protein
MAASGGGHAGASRKCDSDHDLARVGPGIKRAGWGTRLGALDGVPGASEGGRRRGAGWRRRRAIARKGEGDREREKRPASGPTTR